MEACWIYISKFTKLAFGAEDCVELLFLLLNELLRIDMRTDKNWTDIDKNLSIPALQVTFTRRIAHVRIPVERAIGRLKVYKILSQVVLITIIY